MKKCKHLETTFETKLPQSTLMPVCSQNKIFNRVLQTKLRIRESGLSGEILVVGSYSLTVGRFLLFGSVFVIADALPVSFQLRARVAELTAAAVTLTTASCSCTDTFSVSPITKRGRKERLPFVRE